MFGTFIAIVVILGAVILVIIGIACLIWDGLNCDFRAFNTYSDKVSKAKITFDEFLLFYNCNKNNLTCRRGLLVFDDCKKHICLQFATRRDYKKYIKWLKAQEEQKATEKENSNKEYIIQSTLKKIQALKRETEREKEKSNKELKDVLNFQKDLLEYAGKKNKED